MSVQFPRRVNANFVTFWPILIPTVRLATAFMPKVASMNSQGYRWNKSGRPGVRSTTGFTLIEAVSVMAIAAILLAIGVPSFRYVTTSNRMSSDINGLLGDLQFARAEAIRQGLPVTVCATTDQASCANSALAWNSGWLIFADPANTGVVDANETVLRTQIPFTHGETMQADQAMSYVNFNREGFVTNAPASGVTITLHNASPADPQYTRCLSFTIVGAMSTQIPGTPTAEGPACGP